MSKSLALPLLLFTVGLASADTLVMKDGKVIPWQGLRDLGDTVEVETLQGTKITVAKKDIDRVIFANPQTALTGATFTFDKKSKLEAIDLLTKIDVKKALNGEGRLSGGTLTLVGNTASAHSKFPITHTPPEEYDITIVVTRKSGADDFIVGLVGGGKQFNFHFDVDKSSLAHANGCETKKATVFGKESRTVRFMVRREGMVVQVDGADFYTVSGWGSVSLHPLLAIPDKGALFLGALNSTFVVQKMILTSPKSEGQKP